MSGYRLESGGIIERSRPVNFRFDGKSYRGYQGDTLASALLANGVMLFGRSFKYHRPRGIIGIGTEETGALMTLRTGARREPNIQATNVELFDGLEARSQYAWPSLRWDVMAINSLASPFFVAGFYYKTFMGPTKRSWMLFEPFIRKAAGLGIASKQRDPDSYDKRNHFCDILVVGGGPAGLAAAMAAARAGARVTLIEDKADFGGALRGSAGPIGGSPATYWISSTIKTLQELGVILLPRTTVFGYYDNQTLGALERVADHRLEPEVGEPRQRMWNIRCKEVVLATGAMERLMVFPGNDRPGVMLADSVRQYAEIYGVGCGKAVSIFTNNNSGYQVASTLHQRGVSIAAIVDARVDVADDCCRVAKEIGCPYHTGSVVRSVKGRKAVKAITISPIDMPYQISQIETDCLAVSGGWNPVVHLASQMGHAPVYDNRICSFVPATPAATVSWRAAGAISGNFGTEDCLTEGQKIGILVARAAGFKVGKLKNIPAENLFIGDNPLILPEISGKGKAFVDIQNDVCASDVKLAHREGYRSVEHLKRYTTLGMGTDQGKTSNVNAIAVLAQVEKKAVDLVGTTRFRPPYTPVSLGALSGRHVAGDYQAVRRTPMQDWHEANGGMMSEVGPWLRPRAYLHGSETLREAYIREARNVREAVGMCDVSTLGKIDVQGPDATEFLNRVYSNPFLKVPAGKARYGLMLREDGMLLDDGTSWRISETQYLMTTTTGGAGVVMLHLERLLALFWPNLRVSVTSTTSQWAGMSLAGPKAREVLQAALPQIDVSDDALPFMGLLQAEMNGASVLIARLSFSGELAFEIFCGSDHGLGVWEYLASVGAEFGIMPYGTEALGTLRIEKGHIAGGELDGRISPHNVGLSAMLSAKKDFFGSQLANREGLQDPQRYELVGVISTSNQPLRAGSHIVEGEKKSHGPSKGFVSSTTYSPALNCEIALALVKGGNARIGTDMFAADPVHAKHHPVKIVSAHFYDPEGARMRG